MEQVRFGLGYIRRSPGLSEGAQPCDCPFRRYTVLGGVLGCGKGGSELLQALEVGLVTDAAGHVLEGEIAHLALGPGAVDGHGPPDPTERRDDPGDDSVIKLDRANLGEHGRLPRLVGQASPPAPVDALAEKTPDRSPFESLIRAFTWTASVALPPRR